MHKNLNTVKSFNFVGARLRGLMMMDMFVDTGIRGFETICNISNK